jgi:hypothetical protein
MYLKMKRIIERVIEWIIVTLQSPYSAPYYARMGDVVKFYTEEEYAEILAQNQQLLAGSPEFEAMTSHHSKGVMRQDFSRKDVVRAFQRAFELIGGIPRLALWAHDNPTDFYKLYARLLPSQASPALGEANEMTVIHVIPRSTLDE